MSGQHRDREPEDCPSCCGLFDVVKENHANPSAAPATLAALGQRAGLGERAARLHLTHLVAKGRVQADRRTPGPIPMGSLAEQVPADADAITWAALQNAPHPACSKILNDGFARHAGPSLSGEFTWEGLAAGLSMPLRTVKRHGPHLGVRKETDRADAIRAGLVEFIVGTTVTAEGRRTRTASRFVLMHGTFAAPLLPQGVDVAAMAARVLDRGAFWWPAHSPKRDRTRALRAVAARLRIGWPEDVLTRRLQVTPREFVLNPYGLVTSLLPAPGERYFQPANRRPVAVECLECGRPVPAGAPYCGGQVCKHADAPAPLGTVDLAVVRHRFAALTSA